MNNALQRKQVAEDEVTRLKAITESIQRKLDGGSQAVTAEDLVARQRELIAAQDALVAANNELGAIRH